MCPVVPVEAVRHGHRRSCMYSSPLPSTCVVVEVLVGGHTSMSVGDGHPQATDMGDKVYPSQVTGIVVDIKFLASKDMGELHSCSPRLIAILICAHLLCAIGDLAA